MHYLLFSQLYIIFTAEKGDGENLLSVSFLRGKLKQYSMSNTTIKVNNNGSLRIEGDFQITDKDGNVYDLGGRTVVSLCRCGRSANKPFCDSSHKGHFEHEAVAFVLPPKKVD